MVFSIAALGMGFFLASSPPLAGTTPVYALYSSRIFGELKKETNEPSILIRQEHGYGIPERVTGVGTMRVRVRVLLLHTLHLHPHPSLGLLIHVGIYPP